MILTNVSVERMNQMANENISKDTIKSAFDFLLKFPEEGMKILNSELCMPNIPFPTMGGHTFWTTLCQYQGYKLQQNQFTHHARILDSNDIRIAWGTVNGMKMTLERMANMSEKYSHNSSANQAKSIVDVEDELISIKIFLIKEFSPKKNLILKRQNTLSNKIIRKALAIN